MISAAWSWLEFALLALAIGAGGWRLTREADALAERLALSRTWVGVTLVATVTSLPELASGISAVTIADAPDIAVGNALGACVTNLAFLVVVDLLVRGNPLYRQASQGHILAAGFGVAMLGIVAAAVIAGPGVPGAARGDDRWPGFGATTPVLLLIYVVAMRTVYAHEHANARDDARPRRDPRWRAHALRFALAALVVLAAGTRLPFVAGDIADAMRWSDSFVGAVFVAATTTLPEMAVTLAAVRVGALDLAIGNLLGSNLFNVAILAVDDVFYPGGALLAEVSPVHAASAATAAAMTGLAVVGLFYRPRVRLLRSVGWVGIGLAAMYVVHTALLYGAHR